MTKNTTRKGVALGAGLALVASGFAGLPANAAGIDNSYVALAPTSGTEYDQLQALTLDLTGSFVNAAASGGALKYLVTDADKVFKADVDVNASTAADTNTMAYAGGTVTAAAIAAGVVTLTTTTAAHTILVGDRITVSNVTVSTGADDVNAEQTVTAVGSGTISFKVTTATAIAVGTAAIAIAKTAETGNATRAEIATADLGSRSVLGTTATISARAADGSFVVDTQDVASAGVDNVLRLVSTAAADTSATATVTAWIDNNDNGLIDSTEYVSPTRTVRFLKTADVTFTTAFDTVVLGGSTQSATVSIAGVNMSQIPSTAIDVDFGLNGAATDADANASYSATTKVLEASASQAIVAGTYSAQADYGTVNVGAVVYKTVSAAATDISSVTAAAAAGSSNVSGSTIKTGTTSVSMSSTVKYWSAYAAGGGTQSAAPAGVPAVVTITKTTLAAGSTVTAGGKTLASTGTSISFDTTTNALGKVVFDLTATGTKGTVVTVDVKLEDQDTSGTGTAAGSTGGFKSASTTTLTWADATVATIDLATALGFGGEMGIAKGSVNTLSYDIRDNFGASSAVAGTYRVKLTIGTVTGGASWTGSTPVSAGKASYAFTDNTVTATGVYTVTATLQKLNVGGTAYDTDVTTTTTVVRVGSAAASTVSATTAVTTGSGIAIDAEDFVSQDYRLDVNSDTFPYTAAGFQITGTVRDSVGAPVAGAAVVVSAAGVAFAAPQSTNFTTYTDSVASIGSATVYTNSSGAYSVTAWSHKAGANAFTVTSGAASTTTSALWAYATTIDEDTNIVLSAPETALPASVAKGSVTLTDKWGNIIKGAIAITFSQTGPGYIVSVPTAVSATTGSAEFVLLTGANDAGAAVITVTHGAGTVATTDDVTASKTITIGAAPVTQKVNAGSFKGYVAVYAKGYEGHRLSAKVGKDWVIVPSIPAATNDLYRHVEFTGAGVDVAVRIYIDRVLVDTINLTTK